MRIELITMWYNEEFLAPFFLNHYAWVDRIHILLDADTDDATAEIAARYPNVVIEPFTFPDGMDDILKSTAISQKYLSLSDADYVIIVDSDEFIFPWDPLRTVRDHLHATKCDAYFVNLWQIYCHKDDCPLDPRLPVFLQRRHGDPEMESTENVGYLKPIVVRGGLEIFWGIGNHYIVSNGIKLEWESRGLAAETPLKMAIERETMLQGAHWRLVDLAETIRRRIINRKGRQSAVNLDRGLTAHYHHITEADIVAEYERHRHDPAVIPLPKHAVPDDLEALELLRRKFAEGVTAYNAGDQNGARRSYQECLRMVPELHDARLNLAVSLGCTGNHAEAIPELGFILCYQPEHLRARVMLGQALLKAGRPGEGLEQFLTAHRHHPDQPEPARGAAEALYVLQRYDEARTWVRHLLERNPDDYGVLVLQAAVERTEDPEQALSLYRRLCSERPDDHRTRLFHATLLLSLGRFSEGWREFEERIPGLQMSPDVLAIPRWQSEPLRGKTIVLVAEQGHGDAIQFIRYAPMVARLGARVMVLCHNEQIRPLLATVEGVEWAVIPREPLPVHPDYHCPLMSLPLLFGTTIDTIPPAGYLYPDPVRCAAWRQRVNAYQGLKVGLVWAGNPAQADNARRSVPLGMLRSLLECEGVTFFSLQVGPDALKYRKERERPSMVDWSDELIDYRDTAALVASLDLVISICSSVTHLSGAIGVPTWVMLQYDADWRWLRERADSPWYRSVRLFRQTRPGAWEGVLGQVRHELELLGSGGKAQSAQVHCAPAAGCYAVDNRDPSVVAAACYQAGVAAFTAGDIGKAEMCFREALTHDISHCDALNGLATVLDQRGETEEAVRLYRRALARVPDVPLVLFNLANSLRRTGHPEEPETLYRRAVSLAPDFAPAYAGLGNLLLQNDHCDEAEAVLFRSLEIDPNQPNVLCDLGVLAAKRNDASLAEERFRQSVGVDPAHPAALNHLGMLLMRQNRLAEAESCFRRALVAKPDYWLAQNNLGVLLHWAGRLEEAEVCHRRFIAAQPDNGTPRFNLALVLLSRGKWREAWTEYEYRFSKENPVPVRFAETKRWDGEDIGGKTLLVHAEQGYGDTIQFARYLPLLAQRGARIVLECQDQVIAPLFKMMPCLTAVLARGDAIPPADFQIPLMSLPLVLGEPAWQEPVAVNYLAAEPQRVHAWKERLSHLPGRLVGVVWSGRRGQDNNHNRMIPPGIFARLGDIPGISFVNLLVGVDDPEADKALSSLEMFDARPFLKDFADTAALLSCLDRLVSVDTATPHLAGAMGLRTLVMIPYNADWRWTFGLPGCPLYPSVTLYRQEKPFEWGPVMEAVCADLQFEG